jgi:hypothetical protein
MNYFDELLQSNDDLIKNAATMLDQITSQYQTKQITEAEYRELCNNVLDYQQVVSNVTDMDRKQLIWTAFQQLYTIVSAILQL